MRKSAGLLLVVFALVGCASSHTDSFADAAHVPTSDASPLSPPAAPAEAADASAPVTPDASADAACAGRYWWPDRDGDGYGETAAAPLFSCVPLTGYATRDGDCADGDPLAHVGQAGFFVVPVNGAAPALAFDFDCDGKVTGEFEGIAFCQSVGGCARINGIWADVPPLCGRSGQTVEDCGRPSTHCAPTYGSAVQRCR